MLKTAYKEDDLGKTQIYEWSSHFLSGEMTINDKLGPELAKFEFLLNFVH